jgi:hypothetical protein
MKRCLPTCCSVLLYDGFLKRKILFYRKPCAARGVLEKRSMSYECLRDVSIAEETIRMLLEFVANVRVWTYY